MTHKRDSNLDFLRALAIIAVLIYHFQGMWPTKYPAVSSFAHLGKYGVTLFFVLSGWLIGGIFWRNQDQPENSSTIIFWLRRWLRTVPPYLAGMTLGYIAVRIGRNQAFDIRYLYFGQNYSETMPFYTVSWSLCVEEHFYLLLPLIGLFALRMPKPKAAIFLWILPLLSPLLRLVDPGVEFQSPFGYSSTATHLVSEGLALGVAAAFTARHFPSQWGLIQRVAKQLSLPFLLLFLSVAFWTPAMEFLVGQSVIAFCCFIWLAATAGQKNLPFASSRLIYAIAITSYSVYLTHSMVLHVGQRYVQTSGALTSEVTCLAIWIAMVAIAGAGFYYTVELPSIWFRNYVSTMLRPSKS